MKHTPALIAALVFSAALVGCGIAFTPADEGNEFFQSLDVTGDQRAGLTLTAAVSYDQYYDVEVLMACELRQEKSLIKPIAEVAVMPLVNGSPDATPLPGNFAFDFVVDEPGKYRVECLTPRDEDNYIVDEFTIAAAPAETPTPVLGADENAQ